MSINFENLLYQFLALTVWIFLAAAVYVLVEDQVKKASARTQDLMTAYVLWLPIGLAGAHRIYCNRMSGLVMLTATASALLISLAIGTGPITIPGLNLQIPGGFDIALGYLSFTLPILLIPVVIWWLVDAFAIPRWIEQQTAMAPPPGSAKPTDAATSA